MLVDEITITLFHLILCYTTPTIECHNGDVEKNDAFDAENDTLTNSNSIYMRDLNAFGTSRSRNSGLNSNTNFNNVLQKLPPNGVRLRTRRPVPNRDQRLLTSDNDVILRSNFAYVNRLNGLGKTNTGISDHSIVKNSVFTVNAFVALVKFTIFILTVVSAAYGVVKRGKRMRDVMLINSKYEMTVDDIQIV